jgi:hypothetical protein
VAEYEALILGLNTLKYLGEKRIVVHGDSELVINQIKGVYQTKHPRMREYINVVLDLLEYFTEYDVSLIPRGQNMIADALATSANIFKIPIHPNKKYEVEVRHRPTVPDNVKYWQVFEDDQQSSGFSNYQKNLQIPILMRKIFLIRIQKKVCFQIQMII